MEGSNTRRCWAAFVLSLGKSSDIKCGFDVDDENVLQKFSHNERTKAAFGLWNLRMKDCTAEYTST